MKFYIYKMLNMHKDEIILKKEVAGKKWDVATVNIVWKKLVLETRNKKTFLFFHSYRCERDLRKWKTILNRSNV